MHKLNSTAVMQRRVEALDSADDFPTPPWGTRALFRYVIGAFTEPWGDSVLEPACNRGYMVRVLQEWFLSGNVRFGDAYNYKDRRCVYTPRDYLRTTYPCNFDWVVTNPPFRLAEEFVTRALSHTNKGVAILARVAFLEGIERYEKLYSRRPPSIVAQFVQRLPMVKGIVDPDAVSATAYAWFVWLHGDASGVTRVVWIPPCRAELEWPGDYPTRIPLTWRRWGITV